MLNCSIFGRPRDKIKKKEESSFFKCVIPPDLYGIGASSVYTLVNAQTMNKQEVFVQVL